MRVLIIEDDPDIAGNLCDFLENRGHAADLARDGINGLYITPLGNALQVVRDQDKQINAAKGNPDAKSEAIIIADRDTPYRLLLEVLYTLGQSEFGKFRLMVLSGSAIKQQQ